MSKEIINTKNAPEPIGPYSQAIKYNDTVYVSGQIALDPKSGELINGSLKIETRQVLKNLDAILTASGSSINNVIKCSIFITDMDSFGEINAIYGEYFSANPPARETVEVSGLPKGVRVEISCIAHV